MRVCVYLSAATIAIAGVPAWGGSLRCDNDLVRAGDSVLAVTDACGLPDREVAIIGEDDQRVGTAFYYRLENRADRKVHFRGGSVTMIERLD